MAYVKRVAVAAGLCLIAQQVPALLLLIADSWRGKATGIAFVPGELRHALITAAVLGVFLGSGWHIVRRNHPPQP